MATDLEQAREVGRNSLEYLCKHLLGMKDWSAVHGELSKFLKSSGKRKLIELPRGHLKSSIVTKGWAIQQVLRNPDIRILLANNTWDNSRKFLRSIEKYLARGSMIEMLYGIQQSSHWNQDECTVRSRKKILDAPTIATTGIEKEQTSQHYDLIIGDDLVARENVMTAEQRQKVKLYYKDLLDLLEPDGTLVMIGTRWHQDDLYADLEDDKSFDRFIKQAYTDDSRTSVIFPEKFSLDYLNTLRAAKGSYEFSAQYLNNPIDEEASDFKREQIRYYDGATAHPRSLYLTVDPAISLSKDADYTAMVVAGQFKNKRIRVVDYVHKKMVPDELVTKIFELMAKWNLHRMGIETFAFQKTLKYEIQRRQRETNKFFTVDELGKRHSGKGENHWSKEARIRRLQPYFEQGLIEIRRDMQAFEDELLAFPRGRHDDLIDCLAYQLDYLVPSIGEAQEDEVVAYERRPIRVGDVFDQVMRGGNATLIEKFWSDLKRQPPGIAVKRAA